MSRTKLKWPNGKRLAVSVCAMLEVWSEGKAPQYSTQTTSLKAGTVNHSGINWSLYGGRTGVWRLLRLFNTHKIPATFLPNAAAIEMFPEAISAIVKSGHTLGGHGYFQDQLLTYLTPDEQRDLIEKCLATFEKHTGKRPEGWMSSVLAYTPETHGLLAQAGIKWHLDSKDTDLPKIVDTNGGPIVAMPSSDFADNRVLRASTMDYFDVYKETFDYLYRNEETALLGLSLHCHFGGRPLVSAVLDKLLTYFAQFPDVWFASHADLAQWALDGNIRDQGSYANRFFAD